MGAIRDFLDSVGRTKTPYTGSAIPGTPPADTASAADKAAFEESVRKYQLDRRAYEQYNTELNNRLRSFNPYADTQYRVASTTPPPGATSVSVATPAAPTPPTQLRAPTYGAISQFSNLTPQQQADLYLQQRAIGYTDADIRKATAGQIGTPSEEMMAGIYKTAYPQFTSAIESQYGSQFNRSGYGTGAGQIDYPGFNYYINQLSTGAVTPDTLESAIRGGAGTTTTPGTTPGTTAPTTPASDINALYQQYFNRQADPAGLQYWQQSGLTGDALRNAVIAGAQGPDLDYYNSVYNRPNDPGHFAARGGYISKYADGGRVRTHYQTGGETELYVPPLRRSPAAGPVIRPSDPAYFERLLDSRRQTYNVNSPRNFAGLALMPIENVGEGSLISADIPRQRLEGLMNIEGTGEGSSISSDVPRRRFEGLMNIEGTGEGVPIASSGERVTNNEGGQGPAPRGAAPRSPLEEMLNRYMGVTGEAGRELASARQRSQAESEAFYNLIRQQAERGESPTSRAELYFRLASAFGAPTRTGHMGETLSNVGQQMGEYTRGRRAEEGERRNLLLRAQEARMGAAREDLATTRALAAQEAQERRALVAKLLEISARDPSERERKIADIMRTNNVDYATASNIVNGIVVIRDNPVTNEQEQVNVLTGEVAPLRRAAAPAAPAATPSAGGAAGEPAAPGAAPSATPGRPSSTQPRRTLWEMAPSVTGIAPAVQEAAQGVTGQAGINVATEGLIRDRQTFATVQNDLIRALSVNPRFPVAEMQRIEREIAIAPGVFTDPRSLRERMVSVNTYLRDRLQNEDRAANDTSLPRADRQAALSAANNIRNFLAQLGVPEGAETSQLPSSSRSSRGNRQPSRPSEQGGWSIQPIE